MKRTFNIFSLAMILAFMGSLTGMPPVVARAGNGANSIRNNSVSNFRYVDDTGVNTADCSDSLNPCAAIAYAISQSVTGDIINVAAGTYTESDITVDKDLTIMGAGASSTIVQAEVNPGLTSSRVFFINFDVTATLDGLTIQNGGNGASPIFGGGIYNDGILNLNNSAVSSNAAGSGGGIYNGGIASLQNTIVTGNTQGGDCFGQSLISLDYNTIGSGCIFVLNGAHDVVVPDPTTGFSPLQDNGTYSSLPSVDSITLASIDPTSGLSVDFTVTFSKPVLNVDVTDFGLYTTGVSSPAVTGVSGTGPYTVTVNPGIGNGTVRLDVLGTSDITDIDSTPLSGLPYTSGSAYTVNKRITVYSQDVNDGWINGIGQFNATSPVINVGDNSQNKQYVGILSFDTSSLPDDATITMATLKVAKQGIIGTDPFTIFNGLWVDVRNGAFNNNAALEAADFSAAASKQSVGIMNDTLIGKWYHRTWTSDIFPYLNLTGTTQMRLRFRTASNNNNLPDYVKFSSGNSVADPQLIIDYYIDAAPTVDSITLASADPTSALSVDFTVAFSEPVLNVDVTDFDLYTTGVSGAAITGISGTGPYTVTVDPGIGNGTVRLDVLGTSDIIDAVSNPLSGTPYTSGAAYTVTKRLTAYSQAANDGWINGIGQFNTSSTVINLGDNSQNQQYIGILSFDTTPLPDTLTITMVTLKVVNQGVVGTDPFSIFNGMWVDVRNGAFNDNAALEAVDFSAAASKQSVGLMNNTPIGNLYHRTWTSDIFSYLNLSGLTQMRLRFRIASNNNNLADYIKFSSGNSGADPQLIIDYYIP